jgi:hypothetical protein
MTNKYKIKFRSGNWSWRSEEQVKAAKHFTEAVLNGQHATWTYTDVQRAASEATTSTVMESQQEDSESAFGTGYGPELMFQDIIMTSDTVEPAGRARQPPSRTNPPRNQKITPDTNATSTSSKYKCGKKVATTNGTNGRFPELQKNRTGWTEGKLHRIDASKLQPYQIVWDVIPEVSHYVGDDEISQLVRHYQRCSARKLINMFCVGLDLLWTCPETSDLARLRWVTVMFWDAKREQYNILFRDGQDAWATGEELDKAIAFKSTYPELLQLQASYEEWDVHAVQAKLITYGLYCAKHVGPPTSTKRTATASLNGRDVHPQRFALPKQSASYDHTTGTAAPRQVPGRDSASHEIVDPATHVPNWPSHGSTGNPFIFKGNPFALREPKATPRDSLDENAKWDREEKDFLCQATHLPSSPSHWSDALVGKDSNESSTQALAQVPLTDSTTSMAAQAMISLGAVTGNALPDAVSEVPVDSQVDAGSVVTTTALPMALPMAGAVSEVPVVELPMADATTTAPTNVDKLAVLRSKLVAMKAKKDDEAKNKQNDTSVSCDTLAQQAKNDPHWAKGEVMCFMVPKSSVVPVKLTNVYGILAKNVFADCSFGTCIMQDGDRMEPNGQNKDISCLKNVIG